jgi:hypothetical protein
VSALRTTLLSGLLLAACSSVPAPFPDAVNCRLADGCDEALEAAADLLREEATETPSNVVVLAGRGPGVFHAEVHVCVGDGRYWLVDVVGPDKRTVEATRRDEGWTNPPCD